MEEISLVLPLSATQEGLPPPSEHDMDGMIIKEGCSPHQQGPEGPNAMPDVEWQPPLGPAGGRGGTGVVDGDDVFASFSPALVTAPVVDHVVQGR